MSAHNVSFSSATSRLQVLLWMLVARLGSRWWLRACFRSLAGCVPVGALVGALSDVSDAPGSSDRIGDLAVAGAMALLLTLLLRWIGKTHGGIVGAFKLTVWSYCFQQAVVAAVYGTWLAAGINGTQPDMGFVAFTAVLTLALGIPSSIMLRRLDPD